MVMVRIQLCSPLPPSFSRRSIRQSHVTYWILLSSLPFHFLVQEVIIEKEPKHIAKSKQSVHKLSKAKSKADHESIRRERPSIRFTSSPSRRRSFHKFEDLGIG